MRIQLRDYQIKAVNEMRNGCILCGGNIIPPTTKYINKKIVTSAVFKKVHEVLQVKKCITCFLLSVNTGWCAPIKLRESL